MTAILTATFLISATVLGLELVLMRALSIGHWHHFSYLVISTALLGFAAGGIVVTTSLNFCKKHCKTTLWCLALGFSLTVPAVFKICQKVPFNELLLVWDYRQVFYLFAYYLLLFIPFLCAGAFVAVVFTAFAEKAHRLYFYNMTGSGLGVAIVIALMYTAAPQQLLLVISAGGILAALVLATIQSIRRFITTLILGAVCFFLFSFNGPFKLEININENKSLVYYQALPKAETIATRHSPLGRLDILQAPAIRCFPGLSVSYQGKLPIQKIIISDADSTTAVNHFESMEDLNCYDYTTSALAYHLTRKPNACIIGAGGGSDVCQALRLGAKKVTAVEMNQQIIELLTDKESNFASGLYNRNDVETVIAEGRNFLQTTNEFFDVINISLLDSPSPSSAGLYALNESHLYTIEAIKKAFGKLRPQGILSITRLLKNPPRDSLKMLATVANALRQLGISNVDEHIIMIRDWSTSTITASMQPFSKSQIAKAGSFSFRRNFDIVCLPGVKKQEVNKFFAFERPVYYESSIQILAGNEDFFDKYAYNIRPATDDKPYFFDFFKWISDSINKRELDYFFRVRIFSSGSNPTASHLRQHYIHFVATGNNQTCEIHPEGKISGIGLFPAARFFLYVS
ncbi:MAG: spermine/spermidine synthase domain-containing protein [Planctomycetota bacterium]|jgi:spermidine synthase